MTKKRIIDKVPTQKYFISFSKLVINYHGLLVIIPDSMPANGLALGDVANESGLSSFGKIVFFREEKAQVC